jgi:hypothetical protein
MTRADRVRPALLLLAAGCAALITISPAANVDDESAYNGAPTVVSGGGVPAMNGVPCVAGCDCAVAPDALSCPELRQPAWLRARQVP